jgi:hypothetical protein
MSVCWLALHQPFRAIAGMASALAIEPWFPVLWSKVKHTVPKFRSITWRHKLVASGIAFCPAAEIASPSPR